MKIRLRALLALIAGILLFLPATAQTVDPDGLGTLTLTCRYDGRAVSGMGYAVYRVASVDGQGSYTLLPAYEDSDADVTVDGDAAHWRQTAERLTTWVEEQKLSADAEAVTDTQGCAAFGTLPTGLYLVIGTPHKWGGYLYSAQPAVIGLPAQQQGGGWQYDVTAEPKLERGGTPPVIVVPDPEPTTPDDKLPQTGLPWLPVTLLAAAGVLLVGLGLLLRRRKY